MNRRVEQEWLDELAVDDPGAVGSRLDLRRLNSWMGNVQIVEGAVRSLQVGGRRVRLAELGAGDGDFLLRVARRLGTSWSGTEATLVDLRNLLSEQTTRHFRELGWHVELRTGDVFDWCRAPAKTHFDLIIANLFLHHFGPEELRGLFRTIAQRSRFFVAVEPRRSFLSLVCSNLVALVGCNAVTRHDAPASVRAGFSGHDLSMLWNGNGAWALNERAAGFFSHLFSATKRTPQEKDRES